MICVYPWLIHSCEFDARIISFENLFGGETLLGEAVGADLAHAYAMPPATADEYELGDTSFVVVFTIDNEELFAEAQNGADASAANVRGAVGPDDLEIGDAV